MVEGGWRECDFRHDVLDAKILGHLSYIRAKGNNSSRPKSVSFHSLLHTSLNVHL